MVSDMTVMIFSIVVAFIIMGGVFYSLHKVIQYIWKDRDNKSNKLEVK
jgi:hypothetical protein